MLLEGIAGMVRGVEARADGLQDHLAGVGRRLLGGVQEPRPVGAGLRAGWDQSLPGAEATISRVASPLDTATQGCSKAGEAGESGNDSA